MQDEVKRVRHEVRQRLLTVRDIQDLGPHMRRIVLGGEALNGFVSLSPDDHVKLFLPVPGGGFETRDYTPRRHDAAAGTLTIDFALHEAGPATRWAASAALGDELVVGGPKGSMIIPDIYDWWLLVGDESALPSIGRRVEEMVPGRQVVTLVAVAGPEDEQHFQTAARHQALWVHRPADQAANAEPMLAALANLTLPAGRGFVWIAAEATVARRLRDHVTQMFKHPATAMKAAGYWVRGLADSHDKLES